MFFFSSQKNQKRDPSALRPQDGKEGKFYRNFGTPFQKPIDNSAKNLIKFSEKIKREKEF